MFTAADERTATDLGLLIARNHGARVTVYRGATRRDGTRPATIFDVAHAARDTARDYGYSENVATAAGLAAMGEALELGFSTSTR